MNTSKPPGHSSVWMLRGQVLLSVAVLVALLAAPGVHAREALLVFSDGQVVAGDAGTPVVDPSRLPRVKLRVGARSGNTFDVTVPVSGIVGRDGSPMKGVRLRSPGRGKFSLLPNGTEVRLQAQIEYTRADGEVRVYDVTVRGEWPLEDGGQEEGPRIAIEARRPGQGPDEPPAFSGWLTGALEIQE